MFPDCRSVAELSGKTKVMVSFKERHINGNKFSLLCTFAQHSTSPENGHQDTDYEQSSAIQAPSHIMEVAKDSYADQSPVAEGSCVICCNILMWRMDSV